MINAIALIIGLAVSASGIFWFKHSFFRRIEPPLEHRNWSPSIIPPDDLPPALACLLTEKFRIGTALVSTIFDLATRGVIEFEGSDDIVIRKNQSKERYSFERLVTDKFATYPYSSRIPSWQLLSIMITFHTLVENEAVQMGLFKDKPSKHINRLALLVCLPMLYIAVAGLIYWDMNLSYITFGWFPFAAILIIAVLAFLFIGRSLKRTDKGENEYYLWKSYKNYLKSLPMHQELSVNDKYKWNGCLGYALAFNGMRRWIKIHNFNNIPIPDWYKPELSIIHAETRKSDSPMSNDDRRGFIKIIKWMELWLRDD